MARDTKKHYIDIITTTLTTYPEAEVSVTKYQNKLRNTRWGLRAFCLCAMNDAVDGWTLYVRPWAGANMCWRARLERLKLDELAEIAGRCETLMRGPVPTVNCGPLS